MVGAAAVALLVVATGEAGDGGRGRRATTTAAAPVADGDGIELLDPGPVTVREGAAVVATDREIVVVSWAGDGAAYEPSSRMWRSIAPAQLPAEAQETTGVWTGTEVVLFRGQATVAWNPETDTWRALPAVPTGPVAAAEWTGAEVVVWPGPAALDPTTGTWRALPRPPVEIDTNRDVVLRWADDQLLLVGPGAGGATGAAYDPATDAWRVLPPPDGLKAEALAGDWNGHELVVVNYDLSAVAYEPGRDQWRPLPPVPAGFSEWYPIVESARGGTAVFMAQSMVIRASDDRWTPLPYDANPSAVPEEADVPTVAAQPVTLDGRLYVFGYSRETEKNAFAAIDLEAGARSPRAVQVGHLSLTLPDGAQLEDARFERYEAVEGLPPAETVTVEISGAAGECSVASTYVGTFGDVALDLRAHSDRIPISVTPVDGSEPWEGLAGLDPDRDLIRLDRDTTDLLEISCGKKGQARTLARFVSARPN